MLVDIFENSGVLKCNDLFWLNILEHSKALDLLIFIEPQSVQSSKVGCHQLLSHYWTAYFGQIFLEELDLYRFLNFGQDRSDIFFEGVNRLILFAVDGERKRMAGQSILDNELDKT